MNEPKKIARVNIKELLFNLEHMPTSRNLMLLGGHGLGKSQIVTKFYEDKGYNVVPLFLGQMSDPGDILGLPYKKEVTLKDGTKTEVMDFLPPAWWDEEKPFCLFLDEINRGRPEILNVVMDLTLNKKIGGRKMPEGSVVVAAANVGDGYTIQDLDKALLDRFAPVIFKPTTDEWLSYAVKSGFDERVIDFITAEPEWLDGDQIEVEDPMDITPSRRSWEGVSETIKAFSGRTFDAMERKMIVSFIGPEAAGAFQSYLEKQKTVDITKLLEGDFDKVKKELKSLKLHEIVGVNDQIKRYMEKDFTPEQKETITVNFKKYLEWLKENKQNEAIGHLMTYFLQHTNWIVLDERIYNLAFEHIKDSL